MRRIWLGLLVAGVLGQGAMAAERIAIWCS